MTEQPSPVGLETYRGVAYPWFCDSMGHMNTQHYCSMFDIATFHFLASLGGLKNLKLRGFGWADRKQTIIYEKELLAGELVTVFTLAIRIGRTSITFLHRMHNTETNVLHASCENVTVLFDLEKRSAAELTPEMCLRAEACLLLGE
ncbi:acyl-CoA thioesterase [Aestuariivirga sp.]|uniref:acyl-CoA thioesterase n=1 Tax=Aestuariivirga sp. TaxID=2650926 RepID=UPI0039E67C86